MLDNAEGPSAVLEGAVVHVLDASEADLPAIVAIYNDEVTHTTAVWNDTVATLEDRRAWWVARVAQGYPVLVAREDAAPGAVGYATFGDWRAWDGYRHTVEHSVYVHPEHRGRGIAGHLMVELVERARGLRKHAMVAGIEAGNLASIRLHERLGFERAGRLTDVGTKFDRWLDLVFMHRLLDSDGPAGRGP